MPDQITTNTDNPSTNKLNATLVEELGVQIESILFLADALYAWDAEALPVRIENCRIMGDLLYKAATKSKNIIEKLEK